MACIRIGNRSKGLNAINGPRTSIIRRLILLRTHLQGSPSGTPLPVRNKWHAHIYTHHRYYANILCTKRGQFEAAQSNGIQDILTTNWSGCNDPNGWESEHPPQDTSTSMGLKSGGLPCLSGYDRLNNSVVAMEDDTMLRRQVRKLIDKLSDDEKKWYLFSSAWDISWQEGQ